MEEILDTVEIIENHSVSGFATSIEKAEGSADADLVAQLREVALTLQAGLPGEQSGAGDIFHKIISRVRGRQMTKDYGVHEAHIEWLSAHVPPQGTAQLQLTHSEAETEGIKISAVGLGLGDGWSFRAKLHRDFLERAKCMAIVETFKVHVRGYAFDDDASDIELRCDIVERVATKIHEWARCPLCNPLPDVPPVLSRKAGPSINLTEDTVGQKIAEEIVLEGSSESEIGLDLKVLGDVGVAAGITYTREVSFTGIVNYYFPPGRVYQPMIRFNHIDMPFWRCDY